MTVTEQLSALDSILAHGDLHCLFQPILSLSERRLVGYEALTRGPSNSPLHSPLALFAVARQCGRLSELELLCRQRAFSRFRDIQGDAMLFLNVSRSPPRSRPSARPHPAIAATAGDLAEPGGDRTDRTDPHRRLRPARHRAAPLSRHGLLHRPRRPRRWLLQPAPVVGTASGLREDRPPLRRRHPPGHRETRVRRLHPEDGAGLSRPGHRRRHRTARGTRGA